MCFARKNSRTVSNHQSSNIRLTFTDITPIARKKWTTLARKESGCELWRLDGPWRETCRRPHHRSATPPPS